MKYLNSLSMCGMCRAMRAAGAPRAQGSEQLWAAPGRVPAAGAEGEQPPGREQHGLLSSLIHLQHALPSGGMEKRSRLWEMRMCFHSRAPGTAALSWGWFHSSGTALLPLSARAPQPGSPWLGDGAWFNPFLQPLPCSCPGRVRAPAPAGYGIPRAQGTARGGSSLFALPGFAPLCPTLPGVPARCV